MVTELIRIDVCPRCGRTLQERFYGPCRDCREDLNLIARNDGRNAQITYAANVEKVRRQEADEAAVRERQAAELRRQFADKANARRAA